MRGLKRPTRRLRAHLTLLALAALVPMLLLAGAAVLIVGSANRAAIERGVQDTGRAVALAVDREVERSLTALDVLATSPYLNHGDLQAFYAQASEVFRQFPAWTTVVLLDPAGQQVINARRPFGTALPSSADRPFFQDVVRTRRPVVSGLMVGKVTGQPDVVFAIPVFRAGELRYVLAAAYEPDGLSELVRHLGLPSEWQVSIIDRENAVIAPRHRPELVVNSLTPPTGHVGGGDEGFSRGRLADGRRVYVAVVRAPVAAWTIALALPVGSLDAPIERALALVIGMGIAVTLLAVGLAGLLARRLEQAIGSLAASADALTRGEAAPGLYSAVAEMQDLALALADAGSARRLAETEREQLLVREHRARQDAESANRAKDEFLALLGHELRNPLSAIVNAVAVLDHIGRPDETTGRVRAIIRRQAQRLTRLVDDLLEVARASSGKILLQRRPVDLGEVVEGCVAAARLNEHEVRVRTESVVVDADRNRLEQVVANLLDNAVKFTPAGGRIAVAVGREADRAVLRVTDTGIGIAPEMLGRVFDPFAQEQQAPDRTQGGLGLGLALVKRLVELHDGTVEAASGGRNRGAEFVVRLPVLATSAVTEPAAAPVPRASRQRILVIEDQADVRDSLRDLLELHGHRVEVAADGVAGLDRLLTSCPDVALIDLGLPGLDGYRVAEAARAAPGGASLFLVALTGYGQPDDRRRTKEAGFDAHVVKPVDEAAILGILADSRAPAGKPHAATAPMALIASSGVAAGAQTPVDPAGAG